MLFGALDLDSVRRFLGFLMGGRAQGAHAARAGYVRGHRSSSKGRPSRHGRGKGRAGKPYVVRGLRP